MGIVDVVYNTYYDIILLIVRIVGFDKDHLFIVDNNSTRCRY